MCPSIRVTPVPPRPPSTERGLLSPRKRETLITCTYSCTTKTPTEAVCSRNLSLKWRGVHIRPPPGPRSHVSPIDRSYAPTRHLRYAAKGRSSEDYLVIGPPFRGTSLIGNNPWLGTYSRVMPKALWCKLWSGRFLQESSTRTL